MQPKLKVCYSRPQLLTWLRNRFPRVDWSPLESELPPIIWRHRWDRLAQNLGLPYSRMYMEQLDSMGEGPNSMSN
jgi:hypothetical protein